jgi:hypothetical protein
MRKELAAVIERIRSELDRIERGDFPERERLEETLTDGYAWALELDAECTRLERRISENARDLGQADSDERARELSVLARRLGRRRRELDALRGLLRSLRTGVAEAQVA